MVQFDLSDDTITIKIPVSSVEGLHAYQKSLIFFLKQVEVESADEATVEAVKKVYELLGYLTPEQSTADSLESLRFLLSGK